MHIENTMINGRLRVSKISLKFRIPIIYKIAEVYPRNLLFLKKVAYFLTASIVFSVSKQNLNTAQ